MLFIYLTLKRRVYVGMGRKSKTVICHPSWLPAVYSAVLGFYSAALGI